MRNIVATLVWLIILFLGAGCAATGTVQVKKGEELLTKTPQCISSLEQVSYEPMPLGKPIKFAFDEKSVVLLEGTKRRFVKGFALPTIKGAYSVDIMSYKSGTIRDPAIMYPEVRILDKDHHVIRTVPYTDFVLRCRQSGEGLNVVLFVNDNSRGERFLLIANRPVDEGEWVASQVNVSNIVPLTVPIEGGFIMWFMPTGSSTPPIKMKASPIGQMEIELKMYSPMRAGK